MSKTNVVATRLDDKDFERFQSLYTGTHRTPSAMLRELIRLAKLSGFPDVEMAGITTDEVPREAV
jgi:hypothetical protein